MSKSIMTAPLAALQEKLAHSAAQADIEIYCDEPVASWFNIPAISDPEIVPTVAEAVEYLEGIGMLERHPAHYVLVRPKSVRQLDPRVLPVLTATVG